ncbi:MAG: DUF3300 domain-containing protein [Candidatus Sulfotelmatobacter sp.]
MKTKLSKTLLTAVLTGAMAFGTGASLEAQDQSMDKPSAGVSVQVDQGPPPEQTAPQYSAPQYNAPQYNAPQYNEQDQGAPQDVAPPPPQDQDAYQDRAYQDQAQAPLPPPPTGPNQQQYTSLPPEQLNKLVAPIALYPDALVAQILAAAAYPTQIVEADRMARENPGLKGQDLANEVDRQDWDPSVKSLVEFPTVLANLDKNLSWTAELGEAYQNQPDDVMQAIQYMRHKAYDAGNLRTTPQERVYEQGPDVDIQPADPDVVYVPTYNPAYVYGYPVGLWPGFYPWWGVGFGGPYISFGIGFPLAPFFGFGWGWHGWGIGWGFHGGVFFGGHPWGYRGGAFYNHAAFVHGNYRGYSSARGGFGARGFAGRGYGSAAGHGYAGHGYASRGFAGNRGAAVNRGAAGNRAYAGNRGFSGGNRAYAGNRGFSGSNRSFAGRGSSAPRAGNFSGGASRGFSSHGGGGSHGGGHFSGGHSSGGHASGGGGGHGGGGHGGRR